MAIQKITSGIIQDGAIAAADIVSVANTAITGNITSSQIAPDQTLNGNVSVTGTLNTPNTFGFKNRIINGGMVIDQRNAGASVSSTGYVTDRFAFDRGVSAATVTGQQSSTVPSSGFTKSLVLTVGTGAATAAGDYSIFRQAIEGYNVADFGLGTASAQTFTLSFWVRSSLTGTFGVAFNNGAANRYYVGSYAISVANTWEQKTVTVAGDTSGTWLTTNGAGMQVYWDIGVGTTYSAAAGAWGTGSNIYGLTGGVKLLANTGATLYITGVQLEKGSTATSFDFRDYTSELAMCQRYYQTIGYGFATLPVIVAGYSGTTSSVGQIKHIVSMRAAPTFSVTGSIEGLDNSLGPVAVTATLSTASAEVTRLSLSHAALTGNAAR